MAAKDLPLPPAMAMDNALGINLDAEQAEIAQYAPFFASYRSLRSGSGSRSGSDPAIKSGNTDIWSALTNALDEYHSVPGGGGEDELFAEFIDVSKVDEEVPVYYQPTPELFRVTSREEVEAESDLSPESIETVGSTTGLGKTPGDTGGVGAGKDSGSGLSELGLGSGLGPGGGGGGGGGLILGDSPMSVAYNGMVFGGWEDDTFDFGVAPA